MKKVSLNPAIVFHAIASMPVKGMGALAEGHDVAADGRALRAIRRAAKGIKRRVLRAEGRRACLEGLLDG